MEKNSKILILGHKGLVGSAILKKLNEEKYSNVIIDNNNPKLDLIIQKNVENLFKEIKPEYVFLTAAKVGGIYANMTFPGQFIYNNLSIQNNVIEYSRKFNVKKLLFLGSSCIFSENTEQPMKEESLLSGPLEPTNQFYAIAKIAGIKMCEAYRIEYGCNFISCQPTNLYGTNEKYDLLNCHVIPATIKKFHEAKVKNINEVVIWGSGNPLREFLHADDLAEACIFLMKKYNDIGIINVGSGFEISIKDLSIMIKNIVGYSGNIVFDISKPDGMPRKFLDCSKINKLGWKPKIKLEEGIKRIYETFNGNKI